MAAKRTVGSTGEKRGCSDGGLKITESNWEGEKEDEKFPMRYQAFTELR